MCANTALGFTFTNAVPEAMWVGECVVVCQQRRDINSPGEAFFIVYWKQSECLMSSRTRLAFSGSSHHV